MKRMATHNSATGEKGKGLISWLVTPFSKTQSKTISEQYEYGCRSFDIRIKKVNKTWHCAHGIWTSKRTFVSIIEEINSFPFRCDVSVTDEGRVDNNDEIISLFNELTSISTGESYLSSMVRMRKASGLSMTR